MKKTAFFALLSTVLGFASANAEVDCIALSVSIKNAVAAEQSRVLEIVSEQVASAPNCSCEIVKAAIEASKANAQLVASIVEAAATSAPDKMSLISQCAVAVAPDALNEVQAVIAKLDPNRGEGENPLDFPGMGPVGPTPGSPGGMIVFPILPPTIIAPPDLSDVD